jgi:hypothetical protein
VLRFFIKRSVVVAAVDVVILDGVPFLGHSPPSSKKGSPAVTPGIRLRHCSLLNLASDITLASKT